MSSPDVESPFSNYSYHHGDVTLSPARTAPSQSSHESSPESRLPPRLRFRSPELFHHILSDAVPPNQGFQSSAINYEETMNDVNRALLSANRAIQNAQEAFQSRRSLSRRTRTPAQEVVDLTGTSPPSNNTALPSTAREPATDDAAYDAFLSRIVHPHDAGPRHPVVHNLLSEPSYGSIDSSMEDPASRYTGPDSLSGPRRRYQNQGPAQLEMQRLFARSHQRRSETRDEQNAIRRQQGARAQWEQSERRRNEHLRLEQQRQRMLSSSTTPLPSRSVRTMPAAASQQQRPPSSPASSISSVEAVDLTQVDDNPSLTAALSKQRQDAVVSQNDSTQTKSAISGIGDGVGRTALTAYKCPICMEVPQNATTTSCGHLFCHKCIIDTLKWSEQARRDELPPSRKVKGVCPVCRKELARKEEPGPGRTLVSLEIKLISKKDLKRKREEEDQKARAEKKGKQKVYDIDDLFDEDEDNKVNLNKIDQIDSSQKENNNTKRFKTSADNSFDNSLDDLFNFGIDEDFM